MFYKTAKASTPQSFNPPPWLYNIPDGWENGRGTVQQLTQVIAKPHRVARVRDNLQRFRRHEFVRCAADKIRLTVEATHGAKTARVFEMRVYADGAPLLMT